jgi:hypothetical protein
MRHGFVDVVQSKNLMIDDAFDQIEDAESHENSTREQLPRPLDMSAMRALPQHDQTEQNEDVRGHMKEPSQRVFTSRLWMLSAG